LAGLPQKKDTKVFTRRLATGYICYTDNKLLYQIRPS